MSAKKTRQLAAIMFTDIVGYSALMQRDEKQAVVFRKKHREVFESMHSRFHGKIVQYYGDGTLSIFKSAVEAVQCAVQIQQQLKEQGPVPLRIGIHQGDIVLDQAEVYGDGVNLAARIENLAVSGSVLVSESLNRELYNQPEIPTVSLGRFKLKNIGHPVEIFAVNAPNLSLPQPGELKANRMAPEKSIAVLPFVNLGGNETDDYFSDGITEEIINALTRIRDLKVTSRTSSFHFKNRDLPVKQIGRELQVSTILEGSVRRSGQLVRITAQLIQAAEDFHFWSATWDRKLDNIFEVQDEISLLIADKLREHFGHLDIQEHLVEKQTENFDAYDYSLQARYYFNRWNPEDVRRALSLYEKAIELDPDHSESYLGLADCYGFLATTGFMPLAETWAKVDELVEKAGKLNDRLPGVYFQQANIAFFTRSDFRQAYLLTLKALEINPWYIDALQFMSFLAVISGKRELSMEYLNVALGLDPLSAETLFYSAYYHYMTANYQTALKQLDACLEKNPKNIPAITIRCYCLLKLGRYQEMIRYFENLPTEVMVRGDQNGLYCLAYSLKKDVQKAARYRQLLQEEAAGPEGFRAYSYLFLLYGATGAVEDAIGWIREAHAQAAILLLMHYADPLVDPIKQDPRYQAFQPILFPEIDTPADNHKKNLLDETVLANYSDRLQKYMTAKKPYLDPDLTLRSLATRLEIHPNQLSWLLNYRFNQNFNGFINQFRVEAFKELARDPRNAHLTLLGLAYQSGFSSKTVFNTFFKKETGITPRQYLKQLSS